MSGLVGRRIATDLVACVVVEFCVRKEGGGRDRNRVCRDVVGWKARLLFTFGKLRLLHHILG
jgi:hypothetical protein